MDAGARPGLLAPRAAKGNNDPDEGRRGRLRDEPPGRGGDCCGPVITQRRQSRRGPAPIPDREPRDPAAGVAACAARFTISAMVARGTTARTCENANAARRTARGRETL